MSNWAYIENFEILKTDAILESWANCLLDVSLESQYAILIAKGFHIFDFGPTL